MNKVNFDTFEMRCSSLGYVMTEPKEKSHAEVWQEAVDKANGFMEKWKAANARYKGIENKETKAAQAAFESIISNQDKYRHWQNVADNIEHLKDIKNLSDTCKTHLVDLYISYVYGRRSEIRSKYIEKGNMKEEDAITLYSIVNNIFFQKNTARKSDGFINGELDFHNEVRIFDTKVSWDIFTFFRNLTKEVNPIYDWQMQGYMKLWDKEDATLVFALVDTPEDLILNEIKKMQYSFVGTEEQLKQKEEDIRHRMTYTDIPDEEKVIEINIARDESKIQRIQPRIIECREFLKELHLNKNLFKNKIK